MIKRYREPNIAFTAHLIRTERFFEMGVRVTEYTYDLPDDTPGPPRVGSQLELIPAGRKPKGRAR